MHKSISVLILSLGLLGCQVTVNQEPNPIPTSSAITENVPSTTLSQTSSRIEEMQTRVISSQSEWESFWLNHTGSNADRPVIDFDEQSVLAVLLGERNTGGYTVEITRVQETARILTVEYQEIEPPADSSVIQILTYPSHVVSIPRSESDYDAINFVKTDA